MRIHFLSFLFIVGCAGAVGAAPQRIESFEEADYPSIRPVICRVERTQEHVSDGEWALEVTFPGSEEDTWPGLFIDLPDTDVESGELLAFDVYNPASESVPLSYRLDLADGSTQFGGETVTPKQWRTVRIWLTSGETGPARIEQVFAYVRSPREDYTLYFDHFRIEASRDRFQRVAYAELAEAPAPTPAEEAFGGVVFGRTPLAHVFENSRPWPGERIEGLACFVARGQTEPMALSVHTVRPLDNLSLEVEPLTGEAGSLPADVVHVGRVRYLDKRTTYSATEYIANLPKYVEPRNAFETLPQGVTQTFWLTVRMPEDAAAGLYRGEAVLRASFEGDNTEFRVPLTVRVLPFTLPEAEGYFIGEYYRAWEYQPGEEGVARMREDLEDMRGRGMTSVGLCFGLDINRISVENDHVDLGFDGTSQFEQFMDLYRDLEFPMPLIMLSDSGQPVANRVAPYGTPEHDAAYKAFWRAVQEACAARGWAELIVQPVDEPGWKSQEIKDRNVYYLRLLKQIPGMRTEVNGPGDAYFHEVAGPYSDMWNYNGAVAPFDQLEEYKRDHIIAFYNNDVEGYRPEVQRYAAGIFQLASGIQGVYNWEYRGGRNDLYNDFDGDSGDWVHYYLPQGDSLGGPALGWEGAREGVDDLRHLILLEAWIARARETHPDAPAVSSAEALVEYLRTSIEATPAVRGRAVWTFTAARDREGFEIDDPEADRFIGGLLKQPNGWTHADYGRARWAVARATLELMALSGENVAIPAGEASAAPQLEFLGAVPYPERTPTTAATQGTAAPTYAIPRLSAAPQLDGDLDDDAWQEALHIPAFGTMGGEEGTFVQTEAYVGWHGESLYVGMRCFEPNPAGIVARLLEDGEPVHLDDCVEVFLDPARTRSEFLQLVVNLRGVQNSLDTVGQPWPDRVPVATAVDESEWRVEMAIPLRYVLADGPAFGFNLARERRAGGDLELTCWKPTGASFGNPSQFAVVALDDADDVVAALPAAAPKLLILRQAPAFALSNGVLHLEAEWQGPPSELDDGDIQVTLESEGQTVATARFPSPASARFAFALETASLPAGAARLEVELLGDGDTELRRAARELQVLPGFAE